jgi:hypothetical protein
MHAEINIEADAPPDNVVKVVSGTGFIICYLEILPIKLQRAMILQNVDT